MITTIIVCAVIISTLVLFFTFKYFISANNSNNPVISATASDTNPHQNVTRSALEMLNNKDLLAEVNKHNALKTEFLKHWDTYVSTVNKSNSLVSKIQDYCKELLSMVTSLHLIDQTGAIKKNVHELEQLKISIPVEKERTANELRRGSAYITDDQVSLYKNQYIPELQKSTASIQQVIPRLEADYKEIQKLSQANDVSSSFTYD
jgi:hypothetical protein